MSTYLYISILYVVSKLDPAIQATGILELEDGLLIRNQLKA